MEQLSILQEIPLYFKQLIIYRSLAKEPLIMELSRKIAKSIAANDLSLLFGWLGKLMELYPDAGNPWAAYLDDQVRYHENYFSLACERGLCEKLPSTIRHAVRLDLNRLNRLRGWEPMFLLSEMATERLPAHIFLPERTEPAFILDQLAEAYRNGVGIFGKYSSFLWHGPKQVFRPVECPDPISWDDLIGIEYQKKIMIQNTRQFLFGHPANNILLYGERGSGKSSSLKALANLYAPQGLRIIEINKSDLTDFPLIIGALRNRGLKFILFIDDLSFENSESQYKQLKAVLEGGLEIKPPNVVIYATSNRRHLIRETFADREDDVHSNDAVQERLSLADRFGITLTFTTPDQREYLEIVRGLAQHRGLVVDPETLTAQATQWAMLHNGRSGRTARQFIDQLQGEMETDKERET